MERQYKRSLVLAFANYRRFLKFAVIGTVGFGTDAGTLQLLVTSADMNAYAARVVSFLLAALVTWWLNRHWTFNVQASPSRREWALYTLGMTAGAGINYGTFALAIYLLPTVARWPVLGVALGSVCGMLLNYATMRHLFLNKTNG